MSEDTVSKDGTDGLVTFSVEVTSSGHPYMKSDPDGDYVTRSQAESEIRKVRKDAEELLAAKDEQLREINELLDAGQGDDDGAQILPDFEDGMSVLGKVEACLALLEDRRDTIEGFEADNAAKEARIKELEAEFDQATGVIEDRSSEYKALEAKLAEARKVFEFFTDVSFDDALVKYQEFQDRAVLGGKPS